MNKLQFAGDVIIEKILITTPSGKYQDITNQVMAIQIFEDLFSPFITGSLIIRDSLDLINMFPLVGEERLDLKISTPFFIQGNIDSKFIITKMTNREVLGDRAVAYELHFISIESLVDINIKISKSFSGKCSDIVSNILTDNFIGLQTDKGIYVEDTINSTKYTSNYWSIVKNLNYLADTSANTNSSPSFTFFENRDGFNFLSLETLYNAKILHEFKYDNYIRDVNAVGNSSRNVMEEYKRIREIKVPTGFDYIKRNQDGMYGSRLFTYDFTTKRYVDSFYDMLATYKDFKHLNANPCVSSAATYGFDSTIITMAKYTDSYTGFGDVTNAKTVQKRISLMAQINANKIEITVAGRCEYTVGMKVFLKLNKIEPISAIDTDTHDEIFSGNYIVSAINHFIDRSAHECTMELVKDSIIMNLDTK